ncbi:peptidase inhibitor family I36 protein [Streptosporangium sp. NPDC023615]|uniref:peptidase inhibitor family I36 protein n=1 Tax=Streptosporangium sp. NPDC023615 TaxID=3154794 RepID=UPI0034286138
MSEISARHPHLARAVTGLAVAVTVLLPTCGAASAAVHSRAADARRPGVTPLPAGSACPSNSLCLYRDHGFGGPAYSVPAGYPVDLNELWMPGGTTGTAADSVSSWFNNTGYTVSLIDHASTNRALQPGHPLEEPPETDDTADAVDWLS